ncbi:MAG: hypothetical protein JWP69_2024 [Flaviaesturariibacter sp.]|nr:hypothetical protein [Flaviaesturariibacter sp.]
MVKGSFFCGRCHYTSFRITPAVTSENSVRALDGFIINIQAPFLNIAQPIIKPPAIWLLPTHGMRCGFRILFEPGNGVQVAITYACRSGFTRILPLGFCRQPNRESLGGDSQGKRNKSYQSSFCFYQRLLYSSSVTFCNQVTIPFSVLGRMYSCCMPVSGLAPCQCSTLGGHLTTSPFLMVCLG